MERICIFCGSSSGANPSYTTAARQAGHLLAKRGIGLVYGGASVGVMGAAADAALKSGGEVIGVIPHALALKEVMHEKLTQQHVVGSMHERKALMAELSSGFVALPGGLGTLEELFEVFTWAQLGMHKKPCGILNVNGYYDPLIGFLDHAVAERFVRPMHRNMIIIEEDFEKLLERFEAYQSPIGHKWIDEESI